MSSPARRRELRRLEEAEAQERARLAGERYMQCCAVPTPMINEFLALEDAFGEAQALAIRDLVKAAMLNWKEFLDV